MRDGAGVWRIAPTVWCDGRQVQLVAVIRGAEQHAVSCPHAELEWKAVSVADVRGAWWSVDPVLESGVWRNRRRVCTTSASTVWIDGALLECMADKRDEPKRTDRQTDRRPGEY